MNALVLGIGNILLQDEGAGVRALQRIEQTYRLPEGVALLDGGTSGLDLLQYFSGQQQLVILDVARMNTRPGEIVRMEGEAVPAFFRHKISPHQLGLSDLLAAARMTGELPETVVFFGIEPCSLETGLELSPEVDRSLDRLAALVAAELSGFGFEMQRREAGSG